jgi:hypothetical protein
LLKLNIKFNKFYYLEYFSVIDTTLPPPTTTPQSCYSGWTDADNSCYRVKFLIHFFILDNLIKVFSKLFDPVQAERLNWFQAKQYCNNLGGDLASFQNRTAQSTVAIGQQLSFKTNSFWLGFNILDKEKGYQWSDGSPVSFTNWQFGQPDNINTIEDCAEIRSAQTWYDSFCYIKQGWMCRVKKGVNPNVDPFVVPETFSGILN